MQNFVHIFATYCILTSSQNIFTATFSSAIRWSLKIPPQLKHVAILPCHFVKYWFSKNEFANNETCTHYTVVI